MIKGVIFDMDGLMFDTERLSFRFWKQAGEKIGYEISEEMVEGFRGRNRASIGKEILDIYGPEFDFDLFGTYKTQAQIQYMEENGVPIKPGLLVLLEYLKEKQIKMAVATSTNQELADWMLEMAQVSAYFDTFVYGNRVERSKPNPDIFLKAAEELHLPMEECLVLEDSSAGVEAGKRAGGYIIHIPDIIVVPEEVKEGITAEMKSLEEVISWIEHANQSV